MTSPTSPNYYAVQMPEFQPSMRNILSITNAQYCVVTTTFDGVNPGAHDYKTGLILRLVIPNNFGMPQANKFKGVITVLSSTTFSMLLNTTNFEPFSVPAYDGINGTPAQVVPVGEVNDSLYQSTMNVLPYP